VGYNSVFVPAIYYIHFHTGQPYTYNSAKEMDDWLDEARGTVDARKRQELYARFQRFIVEQAYWVPMYAQFTIEAASKKLNYEASSDEIMRVTPPPGRTDAGGGAGPWGRSSPGGSSGRSSSASGSR
jgi:ABC-type transport system substrate-binding protein